MIWNLWSNCCRVLPASDLKSKGRLTEDSEDSTGSSSIVRDRLANNAHKLLRSMKQLLAREKTVNITGTGSSSCSSQIAGKSSICLLIIKKTIGHRTGEKYWLYSWYNQFNLHYFLHLGGGIKNGVIITSSKTTDNSTNYKNGLNSKSLKTIQRDSANSCESSDKGNTKNISKISINQNDVLSRRVRFTALPLLLGGLCIYKGRNG